MKLFAVRNPRTDGVDLYATHEAARKAAHDEDDRILEFNVGEPEFVMRPPAPFLTPPAPEDAPPVR